MITWRTYKIFKQNCHYELDGKAVDYWDLSPREQELVEVIADDAVFVEEVEEPADKAAYKYFMQEYGGDEELPSYYILERDDGSWFDHGDTKQIFSDLNYSGF